MTTAIAVHPNDSNVIYIGTAGGGVWKTLDGGDTWRALFDRQAALGIGEPMGIAIDPNDADVVYVGTSGRGRVSSQRQAGLFKSVNGGASWVRLGFGYPSSNTGNATQFANQLINAIIVDPADSSIIYLASGNGVWRSTDGGLNWTRGTGSTGDARSLVLDRSSPANARILYAGISGSGVLRSTDGGQFFTRILSSTTSAVATALAANPGNTMNQVVFDLAPPTSPANAAGIKVIYVAIANGNSNAGADPIGLFMSTDQGATWTQRNAAGGPGTSYNGYCLTLSVDPASPGDGANDILYYGTLSQARSTDSGASFSSLGGLHADTHAWAFFPQPAPTPTIVFCGTDGGISRSVDNGATWTPRNAGGLQTALFYNLDVKPDATASATVGALQDNRLERNTSGLGWNTLAGGDGWDIVYDGVTANQLFATTNSANPATRVLRSTDDGANWSDVTPWPNVAPENGFYLSSLASDPSSAGIIYAASNQNLWQTRDGGNSWRTLVSIPSGFITANVSVAPTAGNNVVVANGTQVLVSTNALAPTVGGPTGVTFTDITLTRGLPSRPVLRVVFDPNDPTVLYAVLGGFSGNPSGHVFRTTISATSWTDISPPLDVPYGAIALDGADTPTTIYVGTEFGVLRSVDRGATWYVLDDLHFPRCPVTDLQIGRGSRVLRAATYGRGVFEFVQPDWPTIAVDLEAGLDFSTRCGGPNYLTLDVFNVGQGDLIINSVQRLMGSTGFRVLPNPGTLLILAAGDHITFTVEFTPTTSGSVETATIRIQSDDPNAPIVDLLATGMQGVPTLVTVIANGGGFGNVCVGEFVNRDVTINNSGSCPLQVQNVSSSSAEFLVPAVVSYPLLISAGDSITLPIRFQPTSFGTKASNITLISNDPTSPRIIAVSGTAPAPELDLIIANTGNFGNACIGSIVDKPLTLLNSGSCTLTVTNVLSSVSEFVVPNVLTHPIQIAAGTAVELPVRFEPTSFGTKSGTITIISDDPTGAKSVDVSGNVFSGKLAITGSTCIGGVKAGCLGERSISICNVGDCKLHVTSVAFKRKNNHWKLINNPFPATLHPGSCLNVLIRYKATEKCPRCCELVITSDDPITPLKILDLMAYTIWNVCGCKKCCDDCHKGCCEKQHHDQCCSAQSLDACCDDEGDNHDDDES